MDLETKCNSINFSEICKLFEKIETISGSEKKFDAIFTKRRVRELNGHSIYPMLRLLLPQDDSERGRYGLKQTLLAKTYIDALNLNKETSIDAQRLLLWKVSDSNLNSKRVDFSSILEDVLKSRVTTTPIENKIKDVNVLLDELASSTGEQAKSNIIREKILRSYSAMEQKWLVRIIFQDLKIGLKKDSVLKRLSPIAFQRFNETNSLRTVCEEICSSKHILTQNNSLQEKKDENIYPDINVSRIDLFSRFSPMLSKGFNKCGDMQYLMAEKAMKGEPFGMEVKIDGERILAHIKKSKSTENLNEFRLFTRNSSDYSDIYCILGSEILKSIKYDIDCIIDGEVAAWDTEFHEKLPFGSNQTVAREELEYNQLLLEKRDNSNSSTSTLKKWLKFTVFDIVYINGPQASDVISRNISCRNKFIISDSSFTPTPGDITNLPLIIRQAILEEIIEPVKDRVEIINKKIVTSSDSGFRQIEIENFFTELIDKGEEGIVIKNLKSTYSLGTRSRELQNWVKLKPDYGNLTDDLDLIILGSYLGSGNNGRGWSYLMGVVDSTESTKYLTVCKVGSGLSYKDQKELQSILQPNEHTWESRSTLPPHFNPWKIIKKEDVPNCWYPPDKSVVLQIKCNELIKTTNYSARICCRFPRVQKVRFDKPYTDIMNSNDLKEIFFRPKNTSETKSFMMESIPQTEITTGTSRNKRKKTPLPKQSNKLLGDNFTIAAVDDSSKESEIFKGILFCVFDSDYSEPIDSLNYSRLEIISIIQKHGGKVSANVPCDICILGNTPSSGYSLSVKNCMAANCYDFVHFCYIIDCVNNQNLLEINPSYYIKMSKETKNKLKDSIDTFGDYYHEDLNPERLSQLFDKISPMINSWTSKAQLLDTTVFGIEDQQIIEDIKNISGKRWDYIYQNMLSEEDREILKII